MPWCRKRVREYKIQRHYTGAYWEVNWRRGGGKNVTVLALGARLLVRHKFNMLCSSETNKEFQGQVLVIRLKIRHLNAMNVT